MESMFNSKSRRLLVFFIIGVIFTSCEYSPDDLYEVNIEPVTAAPDVTIILNFNTDTVYVPSSTTTIFEHQVEGCKLNWINIYIDGELYDSNDESNGTLEFYPDENLSEYYPYQLKIEFLVSSGSGSIADSLAMEGFLYTLEFIIIIVDEDEIGSDITNFQCIDESLLVSWSEYRGTGFQKYILYQGRSDIPGPDTLAIIHDQNITSAFDQSFVGYKQTYFIETVTKHGTYRTYHTTHEDEMPQVAAHFTDNNFLITWNIGKYSNNIAGFKLYESLEYYNNGIEVAYIDGNVDTSFIYDNGKFGIKTVFYLQPVPMINPPVNIQQSSIVYYSTNTGFVYAGDPIPGFSCFNAPIGQYCYYSPFQIIKFDCITQTVVDSAEASGNTIVSSTDGNYLLNSSPNTFYLYNSSDLSIIKQVTTEEISGIDQSAFNYAISNNGILIYYTNQLYAYNILTDEFIGAFDISNCQDDWSRSLRISPNGDFILFRYVTSGYASSTTVLIEMNLNNFSVVWDENVTFYQFDYLQNNFSYYTGGSLITKSLDDFSTVKQYYLGDKYLYHIDYNTYEFVSLNTASDKLRIYDYNTGEIKKEVLTYNFEGQYNSNYGVYLSNKTIFYNDGFKLHMNY